MIVDYIWSAYKYVYILDEIQFDHLLSVVY